MKFNLLPVGAVWCLAVLSIACGDDASDLGGVRQPSSPEADASAPGDSDECSGDWAVACEGCTNFKETMSEVTFDDDGCHCSPFADACFSTDRPDGIGSGAPSILVHVTSGVTIWYPLTGFVPEGFQACSELSEAPAACACATACP